jgi:hypothetical protein
MFREAIWLVVWFSTKKMPLAPPLPLEVQLPVPTATQTWVVSDVAPLNAPVTVISYAPLVVVDVVVAVRVDVTAEVPLMETEVGERLQVGVLTGLETLVVTAQVRVTVPSNEFCGVTVMVEVLPLVAPPVTVMLPPLERVKSELPAGASQNPLQPERKPTARQLIPRTQTMEKLIRSGAAKLRSRASSPKIITAPLKM